MENVMHWVKKFMNRLKAAEGVTLIELLAVVVILAIIAAVAVPAVLGQISKSKQNADKQNEQVIVDAIQRMVLDAESQGLSNIAIGVFSGTTFTAVGGGPTKLAGDSFASGYTGTGSSATVVTASNNQTKVSDVLLNGIQNNGSGYLSTWPSPQTDSSSGADWMISITEPKSGVYQSFNISGVTYYITP